MGSVVTLNDTLRITKEQGFPVELDIATHLKKPYTINDVKDKIFSFSDKPTIRLYKAPPVRNFLVEDLGSKWLYWGLVHMVTITHDMVNESTSGTFKIIHLNTPEEMKIAHHLIDQRPETNYFE